MIFADLPPSSSATRLMFAEAAAATNAPTGVEPVNETTSRPGCLASASPTSSPPATRLNTPAGRPAAAHASANTNEAPGATSAGLSTTVQPAANAGATLQTSRNSG